jgi:hypothetical protein
MTPTIREEDTAVFPGSRSALQIGHFYFDADKGRLHCLNEVARLLRDGGVPVIAEHPTVSSLRGADGAPIAGDRLPISSALSAGRAAEAVFALCRPGQPSHQLHYSASPLKDASGRVGAVLASVASLPPAPDWATMAGLAHDLRTPLQTLGMIGSLLEFRTLPENERQESLERLRRSAQRAQQIAQELLDWCRTRGAISQRPAPEWFTLDAFLREVLAEQALAAGQKKLQLALSLAAAHGWQMFTDRIRFARVLTNLLVNAVRYTPSGGRVHLDASWVEHAGTRRLVLDVHDTGAGIAAHEQESIFNPFERGQTGRDSDTQGSGVGLSVVDRLSHELGLECDVHSVAGQGSHFRVFVPPNLLRMASPAGTAG